MVEPDDGGELEEVPEDELPELRKVKVSTGIEHLEVSLTVFTDALNQQLILEKNEQYGDAWQAEGPFLAASRMKDKIVRVATGLDSRGNTTIAASTTPEAVQDVLEMMAYGKLLLMYLIWNDVGYTPTTVGSVRSFYDNLAQAMIDYPEDFEVDE